MTQDQDTPENVTPLRAMLQGFVAAILIVSIGIFCGFHIGKESAYREQPELTLQLAVANVQLQEMWTWRASIDPWAWFFDCNPNPVAHVQSWDEMRDLVTSACPPGVKPPEDVEAGR